MTGGHSLAEIFSKMEEASRDLNIEDYSVSQNMLDNVSSSHCMLFFSVFCPFLWLQSNLFNMIVVFLSSCLYE